MPSLYLLPSDYANYGVPASTTTAAVQQASTLIDMALTRPEGLIYTANASLPLAMAAPAPSFTFSLQASIASGSNIVATVTPPIVSLDLIGDILVLDNTPNNAAAEACLVTAVTPPSTITLSTVLYSHSSGATADRGMVMEEVLPLSKKTLTVRASRWPVVRLLNAQGRSMYPIPFATQTYPGPPAWVNADLTQTSVDYTQGEIFIPPTSFGQFYPDVRIFYISGYPTIPPIIKQVCANLINAISGTSLPDNIKLARAGDTELVRFVDTAIGQDSRMMIKQYRARIFM